MLTAPEIVKLIKAHNILSKITIPAKNKNNVNALIKLVESKNYMIDHDKKSIKPKVKRGKQITLKQAEELTKPKVDPAVAKQKREAKKKEKEEERKKEIKIAKKEAVKEFKQKKKEASILKNKKKAPKDSRSNKSSGKMKKEDEVRPKEKVGRPKFDPKKIKVIELKKKEESKTFQFQDKKINLKNLLDYIDKEGYKISKSQVDSIKYLIDFRKLSKYRQYFNPNGDMVLVPTTNFKSEKGERVDAEMSSHFKKNTAVLKTILKPKIKKNYSAQEKIDMAKTRINFLQEELKKLKEREKKVKGDELLETKKQIESLDKSIKGTQKLIDSGFKEPEKKIKFKVGDLIVPSKDKKFSKNGARMYEVEEANDYVDEYKARSYLWSDISKEWIKAVPLTEIKIRKTAKGFNWKLASDLPNYKEYVKSNWKENIRK